MNFKFNDDEQKIIDILHEFGVTEVVLLAAEIDGQGPLQTICCRTHAGRTNDLTISGYTV